MKSLTKQELHLYGASSEAITYLQKKKRLIPLLCITGASQGTRKDIGKPTEVDK
jgi:hypothetical protein